MAYIKLQRAVGNCLAVDLEVRYKQKDAPSIVYGLPVPFIIDTAAQRTFLVPFWEERIKSVVGTFDVEASVLPAKTLVGDLKLKAVPGLELYANVSTNPASAKDPKRKLNLHKTWVCVSNNPTGPLCDLKINILGRDVIAERDWCLYWNSKSFTAALLEQETATQRSDIEVWIP